MYQEVDTALIPYLSVAENILMDRIAMNGFGRSINWKSIYNEADRILKDIGINLDVRKLVSELSLSEKQLLLIAKALSIEIKFLILDEPTAPLDSEETKKLFQIIKKLKEKNVGIIYISHRLNEVKEISDKITIMRNGKVTAQLVTSETTKDKIIESMLGATFQAEFPKFDVEIGKEVFRVQNMSYVNKVKKVSFTVHEGEILGIAGLVGAGKTELSKIIFGAEKADSGDIYVNGKLEKITSPSTAISKGIALIPEERRKEGIMVDENIIKNISIASIQKFVTASFIRFANERRKAKEMVDKLNIKTPSVDQDVKNLSGGNQQKVAVAKWLVKDAEVYLLDEPTKGVDVGAKTEVFRLIGELVKNKKGIVYLSNELEEIIGISDRILVMFDGEVVKEITRSEATLDKLLYYCTGGRENE